MVLLSRGRMSWEEELVDGKDSRPREISEVKSTGSVLASTRLSSNSVCSADF